MSVQRENQLELIQKVRDALLRGVDLIKGRELEFSVECEVPGNLQVKM